MVKLGVILLVKMNSAYWHQRASTGAFALCAIRLVKLTPVGWESLLFETILKAEMQKIAVFQWTFNKNT
jgi:hypothetical protein